MKNFKKELTPVSYSAAAIKVLHFNVKENSFCFGMHWHDRLEIIRVKDGKINIDCGLKKFSVKKDEITVFQPGTAHGGATFDSSVEYDVLMFDVRSFYNDTEICKKILPKIFEGSVKFERLIFDEEILKCLDKICYTAAPDSMEITSLVYKLLHLLFDKHVSEEKREADNKAKLFIKYIEENFALDLSTASISAKFGYTPAHFCRKFKEATGIPPTTYVKICRLEEGLKLLKDTDMTVGEISMLCGFSDANYFTRCFKEHYKLPPSYYRKKQAK